MSQTLEAIVSETGEISLLKEIRLEKHHQALVTILNEKPKVSDESKKDRLFAVLEKMRKANMFQDIENPVEWKKKLKDDWEKIYP